MFDFLKKIIGGGSNSANIKEIVSAGAVIVDVRSPGEFAGGHAKGAVNIPLDTLANNLKKIKGYNKPVVLCCASGMRSSRAKGLLTSKGIENVHDAGSWINLK